LHASDWELYKARIIELHIKQDLPLKEVKDKIEKEFGFIAEYVLELAIEGMFFLN
jgi:Clr5 domain